MKKLPLGTSNYKEVAEEGCVYVDKTDAIARICDNAGKVTLITRPRRFGKSLFMSTLRTFFEDERDMSGNKIDNRRCFAGRKIEQFGSKSMDLCGTYPVISISFKDAVGASFEEFCENMCNVLSGEFRRHAYILSSGNIPGPDRELFLACSKMAVPDGTYAHSIRFLSQLLHNISGKRVIILIDEYDAPLNEAYDKNDYDRIVSFMRRLLSAALKDNDALAFAVMTGCLRIARESIFTGLNNLQISSVNSGGFDEYFGFLEEEVKELLAKEGLSSKYEDVRERYDGYLFGKKRVFNPWSIISYIASVRTDPSVSPKAYWVNTSGNSIVRSLIRSSDAKNSDIKRNLETLMNGGSVNIRIREDITYEDIDNDPENIWNLLFFTGYLTRSDNADVLPGGSTSLRIPNLEVASIYKDDIALWIKDVISPTVDKERLVSALQNAKPEEAEQMLGDILLQTVSYMDNNESFYHGFLNGIFTNMPGYNNVSNREAGYGRPDLLLEPDRPEKDPYIVSKIKCLKAGDAADMEKGAQRAIAQIRDRRYTDPFAKGRTVIAYGICFCGKKCLVRLCKDT